MSMSEAEIREALARAERATGGECIVRNRYSHGGGRMYREDGPARDLILDVYDEANREFYFSARTDVPRLAADLLAARAERDEARASLSTPTLAKRQPCGCVVCTCGDVERCGGCGARMCDRHRDDRPSLANDPATVWEAHPLLARAESAEKERDEARAAWKLTVERPTKEELRSALARAETAEARCRELEAERAIVADYLRDADADFRARRPSERAVLDALLSPPPPHTCQIHRATSGASDCGLSPCEEAKVHTDRGASRRAQATPVEDMTRAQVQAELAARGIDVAPAVAKVMDALGRTRECACPDPRCAQHGSAPAPCSSCVGDTAPEAVKCATCGGGEWVLDPPHAPDCDTPVPAGIRHSHRLVWCKCGARGHECPDCGGGA